MMPAPAFDLDSPRFPPLASYMKADLIASPDGHIWLLHDKPLPDILKWADYDIGAGTITLAMHTGKVQELGIAVPKIMTAMLQDAIQISAIFMQDQKVVDFTLVPLNTINVF